MAQKYIIDAFQPPHCAKSPIDVKRIAALMNKDIHYAAMGRYALYHILNSLHVKDKILIPAYICPSVLEPLRLLNITPIFYDSDIIDLNAHYNSIAFLAEKYDVKAVLVASMYGNPADLATIAHWCRSRNIILIDDAAQSFGATIDGRQVGSFGDAGFFSFSPGKPTAGHMGAFFWTSNSAYTITRTHHCLYHMLDYADFYFNRSHRHIYRKFKIFQGLSFTRMVASRLISIVNDDICSFEKNILGGIVTALLDTQFAFRQKYITQFVQTLNDHPYFTIIKGIRGVSHNTKLVIRCRNQNTTRELKQYLHLNRIFCAYGYAPLTHNFTYLPQLQKIQGTILELPIENNEHTMHYLFHTIRRFKLTT